MYTREILKVNMGAECAPFIANSPPLLINCFVGKCPVWQSSRIFFAEYWQQHPPAAFPILFVFGSYRHFEFFICGKINNYYV